MWKYIPLNIVDVGIYTRMYLVSVLLSVLIPFSSWSQTHDVKDRTKIIVQSGFKADAVTSTWLQALESRMSRDKIDSISQVKKEVTTQEKKWKAAIESKAARWNSLRDSLNIPFQNIKLDDTIYILTGYGGYDDGFTFGLQTICLDLTALQREYGNADIAENDSRIDRIFAHEYTHLLHKAWMLRSKYQLKTFRDSILWECLYEGIGMYRSLNTRWLPVHGNLPDTTTKALRELIPVFSQRINTIESGVPLTASQKDSIHKNLSRGAVTKKWGAFPVAIWLSLEAKGNDNNLAQWIDLGPEAVIILSRKYIR